MHTLLITDRTITYDGRQLAPHWIYRQFDLMGDAAVAFIELGDDDAVEDLVRRLAGYGSRGLRPFLHGLAAPPEADVDYPLPPRKARASRKGD